MPACETLPASVVSESADAQRRACRIVLAKVGLDGHDRGIKVVARGLRDAGLHVIYGGIWQTPEAVAQAVVDEDAEWLGLSLLSGAHLTLVPRVLAALDQAGADDVRVVVGGIVPESDVEPLRQAGVAGVFGPGTAIESIVHLLQDSAQVNREFEQIPSERNRPQLQGVASSSVATGTARSRQCLSRRLSELSDAQPAVEQQSTSTCNGGSKPASSRRTIAFAGSAGVGKSSLIARVVKELRRREQRVAVLACDPQSPLTGGALLGDRVRLTEVFPDEGVFFRSLAVPSGHQGIAPGIGLMAGCLHESGFGTVLIETVGLGQGDVAVRNVVDQVVVVVQPESGDSIQWDKAGLLEVADIVVLQKADLPGAGRLQSELADTVNVPVVTVGRDRPDGVGELLDRCVVRR
ncbi:hypothetical protein GC176_26295 [bacterium]|nr:hypothetical protein [bacterium]